MKGHIIIIHSAQYGIKNGIYNILKLKYKKIGNITYHNN